MCGVPRLAEKDLLCDLWPNVFFCPVYVKIMPTLPIKTRKQDERLNTTKIVLDPWGMSAPYHVFNFNNSERY